MKGIFCCDFHWGIIFPSLCIHGHFLWPHPNIFAIITNLQEQPRLVWAAHSGIKTASDWTSGKFNMFDFFICKTWDGLYCTVVLLKSNKIGLVSCLAHDQCYILSSCLLGDCDRAKFFACKVQLCCLLPCALVILWSSEASFGEWTKTWLSLRSTIIPNVITEGHMIVAILKFCSMFWKQSWIIYRLSFVWKYPFSSFLHRHSNQRVAFLSSASQSPPSPQWCVPKWLSSVNM